MLPTAPPTAEVSFLPSQGPAVREQGVGRDACLEASPLGSLPAVSPRGLSCARAHSGCLSLMKKPVPLDEGQPIGPHSPPAPSPKAPCPNTASC